MAKPRRRRSLLRGAVCGEGSAKGYLALMRVEVAVMLAAVLPADAVAHPRR